MRVMKTRSMLATLVVALTVVLPTLPAQALTDRAGAPTIQAGHSSGQRGDCWQWSCTHGDDVHDVLDDIINGHNGHDHNPSDDDLVDPIPETPVAPVDDTGEDPLDLSPTGVQIEVRLAQANLPGRAPAALFARHMKQLASHRPDFITLNEVNRRSRAQITPPGYLSYRSKDSAATAETPVLWRVDTWEKVSHGTAYLTTRTVKWGVRAVNWVTVKHLTTGEVVTVVSAHPAPNRPQTAGLFDEFMGALVDLTGQLATQGQVFIGGDLNVGYRGQRWPKALLAEAGLKTSYGRFGKPLVGTHDGGAVIDYLLFRKTDNLRLTKTGTRQLAGSDHHGIWAKFKIRT